MFWDTILAERGNLPSAAKYPKGKDNKDILHAVLGIASESSELVDNLAAALKNGEFDRENLIEEAGDLCWYLQLLCNALGVRVDEVVMANREKLMKRYPGLKWSEERALARADKA